MEAVCFAASNKARSHMKPRGSPAAAVLTEGKTLPEGTADLEFQHQANGRGILPSDRDDFFSEIQKCVEKTYE